MSGHPAVKRAVALRYRCGADEAPRVVASGRGPIAEHILRIAAEVGIPEYRDGRLAEALAAVSLDAAIPPELYRAVAEALAFVYRLEKRMMAD